MINNEILLLYIPVLHKGYLDFFDRIWSGTIAVLSEDALRSLPNGLEYVWKKDMIRALPSEEMVRVLTCLFHDKGRHVVLADVNFLCEWGKGSVTMPKEDVSIAVAEMYFGNGKVNFVSGPKLRYHRNNVEEKKNLVPSRRIPLSEVDREMMTLSTEASGQSPDWWRQVGGVLVVKDGPRIIGYNEHQPHEQVASAFGDPRSIYKSGVRTDITHGEHAEHVVIGEAARLKVGTDGSTMYLTCFPCLACARLLARAGVKKLFYRDPSYGLLDADLELRSRGVELIEVFDE